MQSDFKSVYETTVNAPVEKVWEALTNPLIVKQYFFGSNLETDWVVGNPIYFKGEYNGMSYQDKGIVLEFEPLHKLSFSYLSNWSGLPDKPENYLFVQYEVFDLKNLTKLVITQSNYDETRAKHSASNWENVIDGLKKILNS